MGAKCRCKAISCCNCCCCPKCKKIWTTHMDQYRGVYLFALLVGCINFLITIIGAALDEWVIYHTEVVQWDGKDSGVLFRCYTTTEGCSTWQKAGQAMLILGITTYVIGIVLMVVLIVFEGPLIRVPRTAGSCYIAGAALIGLGNIIIGVYFLCIMDNIYFPCLGATFILVVIAGYIQIFAGCLVLIKGQDDALWTGREDIHAELVDKTSGSERYPSLSAHTNPSFKDEVHEDYVYQD